MFCGGAPCRGSAMAASGGSSSSSSEFSLEADEGELVVVLEAEPGPAMDARVWSMLPNELIERLLPLVPLLDLFTWRCVSKHCQALLTEERLRSIEGYKEVNGLLVFGARSTCPHQDIPQSLRVATLRVLSGMKETLRYTMRLGSPFLGSPLQANRVDCNSPGFGGTSCNTR